MKKQVRGKRCERLVSLPIDPAGLRSHYFIKRGCSLSARCPWGDAAGLRHNRDPCGCVTRRSGTGSAILWCGVTTVPDLVEQDNGD